ncbi:hypothetical protein OC844_005557, partial [Tilletia horrida]
MHFIETLLILATGGPRSRSQHPVHRLGPDRGGAERCSHGAARRGAGDQAERQTRADAEEGGAVKKRRGAEDDAEQSGSIKKRRGAEQSGLTEEQRGADDQQADVEQSGLIEERRGAPPRPSTRLPRPGNERKFDDVHHDLLIYTVERAVALWPNADENDRPALRTLFARLWLQRDYMSQPGVALANENIYQTDTA